MVDHFEGSFPPFPQAGIGGNLTSAIQGHGQVPLGKKPNSKMQEDRTQDYKLESNTQKKLYGNGRKNCVHSVLELSDPTCNW